MNLKSLSIILLIVILFGGVWFVYQDKQASQKSATSEVNESTSPAPDISAVSTPIVNGGSVVASEISLTISAPINGATVTTSTIAVRGKTKPNADVFVNDETTVADASGNFSVTLTLDEGDNPIVISANDADGNVAEKELIVNYDSGS